MFKRLSLLFATAVAACLMVGCGSSEPADAPASNEPVTDQTKTVEER